MEEWVYRALKKWPNVPALYGWLKLDRRGRWKIKDELITRPQIIEVFDRNYARDERGCWYFQNGPQRGYIELEQAPFMLSAHGANAELTTHNQLPVTRVTDVYMDETGALWMRTEHGPAALLDDELDWALQRMRVVGRLVSEDDLDTALQLASNSVTDIGIRLLNDEHVITRLDTTDIPPRLGFVHRPVPES